MAKTIVKPSKDVEVSAKGNAAPTGMPKQPAMKPVAPDQISSVRKPSAQGYGMNGGAINPSVIPAGANVMSPMAANLKASGDDGESVLDHVIAHGTKLDDEITSQLRNIEPNNVPDHPAMTRRGPGDGSPGGIVPATTGARSAPLIQNPTK